MHFCGDWKHDLAVYALWGLYFALPFVQRIGTAARRLFTRF